MISVENEYTSGKYKILVLSDNIPLEPFRSIQIDGISYEPQIVYDVPNEIAVVSNASFMGKIVDFV